VREPFRGLGTHTQHARNISRPFAESESG
jgi:hypothetical protein